ncbi:MAG TPA: 16S rRNA (guanine(966)-N(2))-methyltransferase RsmD [Thermodesulfobacteriota bacterium]|nr:16S rRNA (guanine(966)-N(2))-methyltransferase RsmD [Thermodesulfobacteriota bacterium]
MRIISGTSGGRRLITPKKDILRPTSDRVKESLFNILGREVEGTVVLDLFAGTGNLGIEALSRGARKAVFVEKSRDALKLIQRNLSICQMEHRSEVLLKEVDQAIPILRRQGACFDLILMDPPYEKGLIEKTLKRLETETIYHDDSILVIEHHRREPLPARSGGWNLIRQRRMGDTLISILKPIHLGS